MVILEYMCSILICVKEGKLIMKILSYSLIFSLFLIAGCQTNPASPPSSLSAHQCQKLLKLANQKLNFGKAKEFSGTVEYTKAATLITAVSIQYEFCKYPNCINKARRARVFMKVDRLTNNIGIKKAQSIIKSDCAF